MVNRLALLSLSTVSILALGCRGGDEQVSTRPAVMPARPDRTTAPAIAGFTPVSGHPGDVVTIEGTHLAGPTQVEFGGVEATGIQEAGGRITATVPADAGSGKITVHCKAGRAESTAAFQVKDAPFDPLVDVAPFRPDQVQHWPGLTNTGSSCFLNTAIKLLASIREVDPALRDHPGDDAATAGVRRQLRFTLNYIRLGDKRPADAQDPMRALIDAFQHHDRLKKHVAGTQGAGGFKDKVLEDVLAMLGLKDAFHIACREKNPGPKFQIDPASPPNSRAIYRGNEVRIF